LVSTDRKEKNVPKILYSQKKNKTKESQYREIEKRIMLQGVEGYLRTEEKINLH